MNDTGMRDRRFHVENIRGVVANYLASQARDPGINSHQHWLIHDI